MKPPFPPGTRVRVIDGTFVSMTGDVLSLSEARAMYETRGGKEPSRLTDRPGAVWVGLTIFNVRVPIQLEESQVEPMP